jgi:hypothetical protein
MPDAVVELVRLHRDDRDSLVKALDEIAADRIRGRVAHPSGEPSALRRRSQSDGQNG